MTDTAPRRRLRCAVYTRKSSEEGLDMEFNSLDAQRESCEAYVASQRAEGWVCMRERYDDGGYSVICPLLSGPKSLLFWTTKEFVNGQEAQAGRDYRQAA